MISVRVCRQKGPSNRLSSRTSGRKHCRVKKIYLIRPRLMKYPARFVLQKGRSNRLSSGTIGHKHYRVDKNLWSGKCMSFESV